MEMAYENYTRNDEVADWATWAYVLVSRFCPHRAEDGTCAHDENETPECNPWACPLMASGGRVEAEEIAREVIAA
jgi:hypothetical protein